MGPQQSRRLSTGFPVLFVDVSVEVSSESCDQRGFEPPRSSQTAQKRDYVEREKGCCSENGHRIPKDDVASQGSRHEHHEANNRSLRPSSAI